MNKIYITSDTHLGHVKIREYCPKFRDYSSTEEMDEGIIKIWNEIVGENDIVYHLGDMFMGPKNKHLDYLNKLNGFINLVPGNHDHYLLKLNKQGLLPEDKLLVLSEIDILKVNNQEFVFCHYPIEDWPNKKGHSENESRNAVHCHGHTHGKLGSPNLWDNEGRPHRYDVGWDCYGKPMSLEYFI